MSFAQIERLAGIDEVVEVVAADASQHFREAALDLVGVRRARRGISR